LSSLASVAPSQPQKLSLLLANYDLAEVAILIDGKISLRLGTIKYSLALQSVLHAASA
jgi:hypothetical protein